MTIQPSDGSGVAAVESTPSPDWQLFDRVPIGMTRRTFDGRLIAANAKILDMLGFPSLEAFAAADHSNVLLSPGLSDIDDAVLSGDFGPHSCVVRRTDGSTFESRLYLRPVTLADGTHALEASIEDISVLSRAEESVRDLQDRYADIFSLSPVALWEESFAGVQEWQSGLRAQGITDFDAYLDEHPSELIRGIEMIEVLAVNNAAVEMMGAASADDLTGPLRGAWATMDENTRQSLRRQVQAVWDGESHLSIDFVGRDIDRKPLYLTLHWAAAGHDGAIDYGRVVVAITNVAARHRREQAVESENKTLGQLYEIIRRVLTMPALGDALWTLADATHRTLEATRCVVLLKSDDTAGRLLRGADTNPPPGCDASSVQCDGVMEWVLREGLSTRCPDVKADTRLGGQDVTGLFREQDGPGLMVPLIEDDTVVGVIGVLRDLDDIPFSETDEIRLSTIASIAVLAVVNARLFSELMENHQELTQVVDQLKRTQAQLLQAQRLEAIGELAAGIAHEINTPIQYVGDNTRFLGDAAIDLASVMEAAQTLASEQTVEAVEAFREAAKRADLDYLLAEVPNAVEQSIEGIARVAEIVRALKEFAHPGEKDYAPVDVNGTIETTVSVSRNEWKYVAELQTDLDPNLPPVDGLSGPLNQVLLNLIVNAAHAIAETATEDKRGTITIVTRSDKDHVELLISDTGCGIPAEMIERIYDPFFTTKEIGKGSGQGLAIAHNVVVEQHHGSIQVESELGIGTTFRILLPIRQEPNQEEAA